VLIGAKKFRSNFPQEDKMNKFTVKTAAIALMLTSTPAMAQSYTAANNAKDHDSTLGSANYVQPERHAEAAPAEPAPQQQAQAAPEPAPMAVEPSSGDSDWGATFRGPYVGGQGVYTKGGSSISGWGGGAFAGYGWTPHVAWVAKPYLGAEAGFDWSSADSDAVAEKKNALISLRPGAVFGENVLGYGILGYSRADFKSNVNDTNDWVGGWTAGLGAELAAMRMPVRVRVEYAYTNYNNADMGGVSVNPHSNDFKLGVVYRFR
jgi:opacity protein-like surface antigen